jgi:hypothetical protein
MWAVAVRHALEGLEYNHLDTPYTNREVWPVVSLLILTKASFYRTF